jgi:beta-lactamase regulating signal transducer with metallopeptidase domain
MNQWLEPLGWTLLHFLWQGSVIALLLAVALRFTSKHESNVRYGMGFFAMVACGVCPLLTFLRLATANGESPLPLGLTSSQSVSQAASTWVSATKHLGQTNGGGSDVWIPVFVWLWAAGVLVLSLRLLAGLWLVDGIRRKRSVAGPDEWQAELAQLAAKLGIKRSIQLRSSNSLDVPSTLGIFRACVIVPASLWTHFPSDQLEALLLHELAHIRRHDYLLNLVQVAIEVVLFYHPAIWWISRTIRIEREHCCDEIVIGITGDSTAYARALSQLDLSRSSSPTLSMYARGGLLLQRIARILSSKNAPVKFTSLWPLVVPTVAVAAGLVTCVHAQAQTPAAKPSAAPVGKVKQKTRKPKVFVVNRNGKATAYAAKEIWTYPTTQGNKDPWLKTYPPGTVLRLDFHPVTGNASRAMIAPKAPKDASPKDVAARAPVAFSSEDQGHKATIVKSELITGTYKSERFEKVIADISEHLSDNINFSYSIAPGMYSAVSVKLGNAELMDALHAVCFAAGASFRRESDGTYYFKPSGAGLGGGASQSAFTNIPFETALNILASEDGIKYVLEHGTYLPVTFSLKDVSPFEAMNLICNAANATYTKGNDVYHISPKSPTSQGGGD